MKCGTCCFKFKGIYYAFGTKFIANDRWYEAWGGKIPYRTEITFSEHNNKLKTLSCYVTNIYNQRLVVYIDYNDIKEITVPNYFGGLTKRDKKLLEEQAREKETGAAGPLTTQIAEREKKVEQLHNDVEENFNAWLIYLVSMSVVTIFKANVFLWIMITLWFLIYKAHEHK